MLWAHVVTTSSFSMCARQEAFSGKKGARVLAANMLLSLDLLTPPEIHRECYTYMSMKFKSSHNPKKQVVPSRQLADNVIQAHAALLQHGMAWMQGLLSADTFATCQRHTEGKLHRVWRQICSAGESYDKRRIMHENPRLA